MKKLLSAMLALIMAVSLCGGFTALAADEAATPTESPAGSGLYPDASYTVQSTDLDNGGKWLYRELVPDVWCEGESSFINMGSNYSVKETTTKQTDAARTSAYAHSGEYSWYRTAMQNRGIAIDFGKGGTIAASTEYNVSAYMRSDMIGADDTKKATQVKAGVFINYVSSECWLNESDLFNLTSKWQKFSKTVTTPSIPSEKTVKLGLAHYKSTGDVYSETRTDKTEPWTINTIYIDDWSIRRALPDDFANAYTKSISPKYVGNGGKVTFTFSLDIDPRTVRKENIKVNNAANSDLVSAVNVTTDDTTRETKLEITLQNMTEGEKYTVSLPELTDAWGRDVTGASETAVTCVTLAEGETVNEEEFDENGNWIYRELVPDVGCEGESSFISVGTNRLTTNTIETNAQRVETYKHSGNYSWYRNAITDRGIGFKLTKDLPESDGTYISTAYVRSDMTGASSGNDASYVHVDMFANYSTAASAAEKHISTPSSTTTTLTKEWTKYTAKFTLPTDYSTTSTLKGGAYITFGITNADGKNTTAPTVTYSKSDEEHTQPVYSIYVDDWSIRRALPDSFRETVMKSAVYDKANAKATFTFNLDIDPRTVRKENIKVDNAANSDLVSAVNVTTNDITRATTLTVQLAESAKGAEHAVSLPELEDAWGREVGSVVSTGLSASEIKVTDCSGNAVSADATLTAGETYTVTITGIYNGTTADADMAAIIALFDGGDKLLDMQLDRKTVTAGTDGGTLSAHVTVPSDKTNCKLKTFVWDLGTLTPYTGLTD